jgi:hypothetical protein
MGSLVTASAVLVAQPDLDESVSEPPMAISVSLPATAQPPNPVETQPTGALCEWSGSRPLPPPPGAQLARAPIPLAGGGRSGKPLPPASRVRLDRATAVPSGQADESKQPMQSLRWIPLAEVRLPILHNRPLAQH